MISQDIQYFILLFALLILPKILLRYRIPTAITALFLGVIANIGLDWFDQSVTLGLLATLGITSLFLFAGLEVEIDELRNDASALIKHLLQSVVVLLITTVGIQYIFELPTRAALLYSLGVLTPSTGFILNSLAGFQFSENQEYWIRSKAIANEIVALIILFFALQSTTVIQLSISTAAMVALVVILPVIFRFFLQKIAPFAPDSEVAFLVLIALLCGVITRKMGAYYLVGAFIVGLTAARFEHFLGRGQSKDILYSLKLFFSFFIPFYFFKAGLGISFDMVTWQGIGIGLGLLVIFIPVRLMSVGLSIRYYLKDSWKDRVEISMSLLPTLVFGLVIANILREEMGLTNELFTGLIIYTLASSIMPSFFLKKAPPDFVMPVPASRGHS